MTENFQAENRRFVAYRLAEQAEPLLLLGDDKKGSYRFIIAPFHQSEEHEKVEIRGGKLYRGWENLSQIGTLHQPSKRKSEQTRYEEKFLLFHSNLQAGTFRKLVLSQPFEFRYNDPAQTFASLCKAYPHSLVYLLYTPETGMWIGATPELLLEQTSKGWETMALAGTKDSETAPWDEKNREEQRVVCQYVKEQLTPLCESVEESPVTTLHTGNLYHLCTKFRFEPKKNTNLDALTDALHPTPAVCGLPKEKAIDFLLENEGYDRAYYAGYLGPVGIDGETHLYVNIRCAQLHSQNKATVYAGSGLLASSTLESEYKEISKKSQALFQTPHV